MPVKAMISGAPCPWATSSPLMRRYHDEEWGNPDPDDDARMFEMLVLEGAQAGLSWATILGRREEYRRVFAGLDPRTLATWSDADLARAVADPGIVRNRAKVRSVRGNARAFLDLAEHESFSAWLWAHVDGTPVVNHPRTQADIEPETPLSRQISAELRAAGMRFVGPVIVQAFLQSVGVVDDHLVGCPAKSR